MALGSFHEIAEPRLVEIAARAGFDFVMLDYEHGLRDLDAVRDALRMARLSGVDALVRIGPADLALVGRLLDEGANGVVIAHVRTVEEARAAVREAYYAPLGHRGLNGTMARAFRTGDPASAAAAHNRHTFVFAIIEDEEGVVNARAIAGLEGVTGLLPGRGDLRFAAALMNQPPQSVDRQVDAILEAGRSTPGAILMDFARSDAAFAATARELGVQALLFGTETAILEANYERLLKQAREIVPASTE